MAKARAVGLGHLVEDLHPLAGPGRIFERDLDAAHGVLDVDEGAGLAAGAVHGERDRSATPGCGPA